MRKCSFFILIVFACLALTGCKKDEYVKLEAQKAELENELEQISAYSEELEQEKDTIQSDLDKLNEENKALFNETLEPNDCFYITVKEYIDTINMLNNDPIQLWENADQVKLFDRLEFEKTKENFIIEYRCEVFNYEDTGESMTLEIEALDTGDIKKIIATYNYADDGTSSESGYIYYYNYLDLFISSFIMANREIYIVDDEFKYLYNRFFENGTYYEGNVWTHNYLSVDKISIVFELLPIGLE